MNRSFYRRSFANLSRLALCLLVLGLALVMPRAAAGRPEQQAPGWPAIQLQRVAGGLAGPVEITHAGDTRLFVVEQRGTIRIIRDGLVMPAPFLDIQSQVSCCGERGLLGLAFPANYAAQGDFYVNYTDTSGDTVVARYRRSANPDAADPASETIVLTVDQPYANHNGGKIAFGPDGFLYIGMGDGGDGGDPQNHAQTPNDLLGKLLRIDTESAGCVTSLAKNPNYCIPPGNPFVGNPAYRPEIWALGLRNPWRFSFDRLTGDLYTADVGQGSQEEVDFQASASRGSENYGWRIREGSACYNPASSCVNPPSYSAPVTTYTHSGGRCSITGGYVFRGPLFAQLRGMYLYGDFCTGEIFGLRSSGGTWESARLLAPANFRITTFGEDASGFVYVANFSSGEIFRITGEVDYTGLPYRLRLPQILR